MVFWGVRAMIQATVEEAQQRLPDLLGAVEAGEEVEIRGERADLSAGRNPAPTAGYWGAEGWPTQRTTRRARRF